jgi:cold-inducible RNA-binding protein
MKNIYVGNLDSTATEHQLRELFSAHGTVQTITIVKDRDTGRARGFGFVEMSNDGEAASAIKALNGILVGERAISVTEARPRLETARGQSDVGRREHRRHRF